MELQIKAKANFITSVTNKKNNNAKPITTKQDINMKRKHPTALEKKALEYINNDSCTSIFNDKTQYYCIHFPNTTHETILLVIWRFGGNG